MADFRSELTRYLEERALQSLDAMCRKLSPPLKAEAHNLEEINAVDFRVSGPGKYWLIDFQYSGDFARYGDIRIDVLSAWQHKGLVALERRALQEEMKRDVPRSAETFAGYLALFMEVVKWGKIYQPDGPQALLYFVYNHAIKTVPDVQGREPDKAFFLRCRDLRDFIDRRWRALISEGRLKLNDKSALGDDHGSAFFAIPFVDLQRANLVRPLKSAVFEGGDR